MTPFVELIAEEEARDLEEHWRLLYVGLTRAEERLVIAGVKPKAKDVRFPRIAGMRSVERALVALGASRDEDGSGARRFATGAPSSRRQSGRSRSRRALTPLAIPDWLGAPGAARSATAAAPGAVGDYGRRRRHHRRRARRNASRRERGTLIHQLVRALAAVEAGATALDGAALARTFGGPDSERWTERKLPTPFAAVLDDPRFSPLVRRRLACRSADRRDAGGRTGGRRNGRPAAGRGRAVFR